MKRLSTDTPPTLAGDTWPETPRWTRSHARALARAFAPLAGDIALVLDEAGVILAAAQGDLPEGQGWAQAWTGRAWADTAAPDSRAKVVRMVGDLVRDGRAGRCEVNHPADDGHPVLVAWTGIRLGDRGPSLAIGRDLAAATRDQQRLLALQAQLEAAYWQLRSRPGGPQEPLN